MIRKSPRIHGWMRQKNVYVRGGRLAGVLQVNRPTPWGALAKLASAQTCCREGGPGATGGAYCPHPAAAWPTTITTTHNT